MVNWVKAPPPEPPSFSTRYKTAVANFCESLKSNNHPVLSRLCGVVFLDFHRAIKIGMRSLLGLSGRHFHVRGLNPVKLNETELKKVPILLINGNAHNQGVWIPMAKLLSKKDLGPLYTLNLPTGKEITEKQIQAINQRVEEIKALYRQNGFKDEFKINLVGYSFGGIAAIEYGKKIETAQKNANTIDNHSDSTHTINKIISLGAPESRTELIQLYESHNNLLSNYYEITAAFDGLTFEKSKLLPANKAEVKTTHLGLPSSKETAKKIIQYLSQ